MRKSVSFVFDKELIDRLKKLSEETYIPQARLAALALDEFITKKEKEMK